MRSFNRLSTGMLVGGSTLVGVSTVVASLVLAAGGATIADRLGQDQVVTPDHQPPAQAVTADCGATGCELWAKAGTVTVPGLGAVPVWGFSTSEAGPVMVPGPTIVANSGDDVTLTVHNRLPAAAGAFAFDALGISLDDRIGAFPTIVGGGDATVHFTADQVGTTAYGAGAATPAGNRQWAMGLSGVLVVRPGECATADAFTGCAYGDPATATNAGSALGYDVGTDAFHDEALVVLNDLDPVFAANPMTADITRYHPTVHLVNGRIGAAAEVIDTMAGHNVLLRYANLGMSDHAMGLVGSHQRTIGRDGEALPYGSDDVTVALNVAQTADVMVTVPLDAKASYRYLLADQIRKPGAMEADPAMAFLSVWGDASVPGVPTGDIWSLAAVACDPLATECTETAGDADLVFAGVVNTPAGAAMATGARFSVDDIGAPLNSTALPGTVTTDGASFSGTLLVSELATLVNGNHVLWVQFTNDGGTTWGSASGIAFTIDRAGPVVSPVLVEPVYSNGTGDVAISATADSTLTGTGEVVSGTATLGECPALAAQPTGTALAPGNGAPGPIVELVGSVPTASLAEGAYPVSVAAVDNRGRWSNDGAPNGSATSLCGLGLLIVDRTGPTTSAVSVSPNPNDGTLAFPTVDSYLDVVRITATVTDLAIGPDVAPAGLAEVEGFIDDGLQTVPPTAAADGTGFRFTAVDGLIDSATEAVYADIPLASVASLTPGAHGIWVHGMDNAGNWGALSATPDTTLTVTSGAPKVTTFTFDRAAGDLGVTGAANGVGVTIDALEYSIGVAPTAAGTGTPVAITPGAVVSTVIPGIALGDVSGPTGNVWVRAHDSTGRWSPAVGLPTASNLTVTQQRRRVNGTATATAPGGITRVEWSTGAAPAAAGTGQNVSTLSNNGTFRIDRNQAFAVGTMIWVRVQDGSGNWGPALSVVV